jgi:hypothetical protein
VLPPVTLTDLTSAAAGYSAPSTFQRMNGAKGGCQRCEESRRGIRERLQRRHDVLADGGIMFRSRASL